MAKNRVLIVLIFLVALAGGGFWYWTGTPQYSVLQLCDALRKHDGLVFRTYFNVDSVSAHAVDDLLSESVREIGGAGLLQKLVGMTIARFFKPELSASLSKKIMDFVEHPPAESSNEVRSVEKDEKSSGQTKVEEGEEEGPISRAVTGFVHKLAEAIKPPSLREVLQAMGINKANFKGFTDYQISGDLCRVGLKFQAPERPQVIVTLELEKKDNHWQVVRFANLDEIARTASGI